MFCALSLVGACLGSENRSGLRKMAHLKRTGSCLLAFWTTTRSTAGLRSSKRWTKKALWMLQSFAAAGLEVSLSEVRVVILTHW